MEKLKETLIKVVIVYISLLSFKQVLNVKQVSTSDGYLYKQVQVLGFAAYSFKVKKYKFDEIK